MYLRVYQFPSPRDYLSYFNLHLLAVSCRLSEAIVGKATRELVHFVWHRMSDKKVEGGEFIRN